MELPRAFSRSYRLLNAELSWRIDRGPEASSARKPSRSRKCVISRMNACSNHCTCTVPKFHLRRNVHGGVISNTIVSAKSSSFADSGHENYQYLLNTGGLKKNSVNNLGALDCLNSRKLLFQSKRTFFSLHRFTRMYRFWIKDDEREAAIVLVDQLRHGSFYSRLYFRTYVFLYYSNALLQVVDGAFY